MMAMGETLLAVVAMLHLATLTNGRNVTVSVTNRFYSWNLCEIVLRLSDGQAINTADLWETYSQEGPTLSNDSGDTASLAIDEVLSNGYEFSVSTCIQARRQDMWSIAINLPEDINIAVVELNGEYSFIPSPAYKRDSR